MKPSEDTLLDWMTSLSNWGRWGIEDRLGTLNLVGPQTVTRAAELVVDGAVVSCARQWHPGSQVDTDGPKLPDHRMIATHDTNSRGDSAGSRFTKEYLGAEVHSRAITHIDSLAHCSWDGRLYNGVAAEVVDAATGAAELGVGMAAGGIVTRGILIDAPYLRGVPRLSAGAGMGVADIELAEARCGIQPEEGDVVLFRAGEPNLRSGPLPEVLPLLRHADVAMLGSDTGNDASPSGYRLFSHPLHQICLVAMGLWILDAADLTALSEACQERSRWEFMFVTGALPIGAATGSPVNPLVIF